MVLADFMMMRILSVTADAAETIAEDDNQQDDAELWWTVFDIIGTIFCVGLVSLISCMLMGFMTLGPLDLQIRSRAAIDVNERQYASALLPAVEQHHRLLVTLLLVNAIAYEALPLFLDNLFPTWATIVLSVSFLLIFGEVLPSAKFTGPDQLRLAARLVPMLNFFTIVLWPISTPIVMLLDRLVPHDEDDLYHRGELAALVRIHHEANEADRIRGIDENQAFVVKSNEWRAFKKEIMEVVQEEKPTKPPPLDHAEVLVVEGALNMRTTVAMDVYTSVHDIYSISCDTILTKAKIVEIFGQGWSRVPVYKPDPNNPESKSAMIGVLMTRQLIVVDWDPAREVSSLPLQIPPCIHPSTNLVDLLKLLQSGGRMMAFVCAQPEVASLAMDKGDSIPSEAGFMGLVTLEDVLEQVLQESIIDEGDQKARNLASAKLSRWAAQKVQQGLQRGMRGSKQESEKFSLIENGQVDRRYT